MVDVNNCTRKRKNDTSDVNEDEVSTSTLQQPSTVENSEPAPKMVKSENVTNDTETLPRIDVERIDIKNSDHENLVILEEENFKLTDDHEGLENVDLSVCNNNINGNINNIDNSIESDSNHHIITIKFHNSSIAENYKNKFVHFLKSIKEFKFIHVSNDLEIKISKNGCESKEDDIRSGEYSRKRKRKKSRTADLFIVDKTPSGESAEKLELKYTSKYSVQSEEKLMNTSKSNASLCFNCNKNHNLRDCPEPKDYNKINAARMKMKSQQVVKTRYHMEDEQKYSHFSPGKITEHLRDALGIYKNELPPYIYKMRLFGYPPGWLEEAKIEHSNMSLFNIEGKEDYKGKNKVTTNINIDKIVEYPGFNMPTEEGVKDDYNLHDCPPFSNRCSKEAMINFLKESYQKEIDNNETCDMDLDQSTDDSTPPPGCEEVFSPSLTDLEKKKLELLAELDNGKYVGETEVQKDIVKNAKIENIDSKKMEVVEEVVEDNTANGDSPSSPVKDVKLSVFGTPIFQSTSPYCVLPHADKFSKDISPVINFENLPNSTGKYEQMSAVIQKVRKTLKDISEKLKP